MAHSALTQSVVRPQKEMLLDSAQAIEYAITTPLLFATLLAASSPTVSTGLVQWAYGSLLASHLLVVPLMYLGHFCATHAQGSSATERLPLTLSILVTLLACAIFQASTHQKQSASLLPSISSLHFYAH